MHYHPSIIKGEPFAGPSGRPGETISLYPVQFRDSGTSLFRSEPCFRNEILELLVRRYMVHTVRCPTGTRFDSPCNRYVREVYDSVCCRGLLIQVERKNDAGSALYYCCSANATERRALGYHD